MSYRDVKDRQQGIALLGAMVVALVLSLLGATLLNLAGQESASAGLASQAAVAQQLADAAGELVVAWFHSPQIVAIVPKLSSLGEKRNYDGEGLLSFFDASGRSQFVGTADQPDVRLHAGNPFDHRLLNDPETGMFRTMTHLGRWRNSKSTRLPSPVSCAQSTPRLQPIPILLSGNRYSCSWVHWTCRH